jgi:hypothetical protein
LTARRDWSGTTTGGQPDPDATIALMETGVTVVVTGARTLGAVGIAHVSGLFALTT